MLALWKRRSPQEKLSAETVQGDHLFIDWRKDCVAGGRASLKVETPPPTTTTPRFTLLLHDKRPMAARIASVERQKKELKAKKLKLETVPMTKTNATSATLDIKSNIKTRRPERKDIADDSLTSSYSICCLLLSE
jgi:hypothetical protein